MIMIKSGKEIYFYKVARTSGSDSRWQHSHLAQPWVPELSKTNLHRLNTDDMSELKISQIRCSCYFVHDPTPTHLKTPLGVTVFVFAPFVYNTLHMQRPWFMRQNTIGSFREETL